MYRIMPKSKDTLTTTIVGEWLIDEGLRKAVNDEMRLFQCAVRTAFNRLLEGMSKGDVEKLVGSIFLINCRYAKDAVMQAQGIISSQRELLKQHKNEKEGAIKGLRKKLETLSDKERHPLIPPDVGVVAGAVARSCEVRSKANEAISPTITTSEDKRESISAKIEQLRKEVANLEGHIKNYTIPKVIFGGRENFEKRRNGKLSNADWKSLRNNKLYSRGDKSKEGGNLNTRIEIEPYGFSMNVAISHLVSEGKTAPRVKGKLWIDVRHRARLREHLEDGGIYSIFLIRGLDNKYRVHIHKTLRRWCTHIRGICPRRSLQFLSRCHRC